MTTLTDLATADLLLHLRSLDRALGAAVERQAARAARIHGTAAAPPYVTDEQARALLDEVARSAADPSPAEPPAPTIEDRATRELLRRDAAELGVELPLDALADHAELDPLELHWIVACAAPEVDAGYGRLYGYVVDDLRRGRPSVELLLGLTGAGARERLQLQHALGPLGRLRRLGILAACGEAVGGLRQELAPAPGVLDFVLGRPLSLELLVDDADDVALPRTASLPPGVDRLRVQRMATGLRDLRLTAVGVWGGEAPERERVAVGLAVNAGRPLRRFDVRRGVDALPLALRTAEAFDALLWIDTDPLLDEEFSLAAASLETALRRCPTPLCLSAAQPWRPGPLLAARTFAEVELEALDFAARRRLWREALPEAGPDAAGDLAARFRLGPSQVGAAASLARVESALAPNGTTLGALAGTAASAVARRRSYRFATLVKPSHTAADLVLPEAQQRQVAEIGTFYRAWPWVSEDWKLWRLGGPGLRVLLTGEAGTGKTLAAETIAGGLGLDLLKVDLGRVVSKWVGETEKNLEASFDEAEGSASVLFFDEADALFARRGEIRHGTDRYANLEVGYLLQRLERYAGLVVLATNLRDNLDDAFTRRFNAIVHFPRPGPEERRRIWRLALPDTAPAGEVDIHALSQLDMTGASIVATARTAALLAAEEGQPAISMRHAVQATARQFHREGRVFSTGELAGHVELL